MTAVQIIEAARALLPFTSEFEHDVIRIPVKNKYPFDVESNLQQNTSTALDKSFYEVEFKKLYINNIAVGWEFIKIY